MKSPEAGKSIPPTLGKSYRGIFPFKIGTTSFIYPDNIIPNVLLLAPYLDEIEIVLFESNKNNLPTNQELSELKAISDDFSISYNIHLPTDIFPGSKEQSLREKAVDTIKHVIDLTSPLPISTYTLHLEYNECTFDKKHTAEWRTNLYNSMEKLVSSGIQGEIISVENLMYPFEWIENIINDFNFSVCIDIGHLILQKIDFDAFFYKFSGITSIIHLHGVKNNIDHTSLACLSKEEIISIIKILNTFKKTVSVEVFSYNDLNISLKYLKDCW